MENETEKTAEESLTIERTFSAPRAEVWKAFTDPKLVKQWWGPKGFTSPFCSVDLYVGGKYLFCMRSPDGKDYWSTGVYTEINEPEVIVCSDSFSDEKGNIVPAAHYGMNPDFPLEMMLYVKLEEMDGKTKLTLKHSGLPEGKDREMAKQGWEESLDKLEKIFSEKK